MGDITPEFRKGDAGQVGITNLSAFAQGAGARTRNEVLAIVAVAIIVVGGLEMLLRVLEV